MTNILFRLLGNPITGNDPDPKTNRARTFHIYQRDPMLVLIVGMTAIGVISLVAIASAVISWIFPWWGWWCGLLVGAVGLILWMQFSRVAPDVLGARQLFAVRLFTNCIVFRPWGISKIVLVPGTQQTLRTPDDPKDKHAVVVQVAQEGSAGIGLPGQSDEQLFELLTVFHLAIWERPLTVIRAYFREFVPYDGESDDEAIERAFEDTVVPNVRNIVIAHADGPIQRKPDSSQRTIEELLTSVAEANEALDEELGNPLGIVGVVLDKVAIEHIYDVRHGGFITRRSEAVRAEVTAQSRKRSAAADAEAQVVEAGERRRGQLAQQETDKAIQEDLKRLLELREVNAMIAAQIDVKSLIARAGAVPGIDAKLALAVSTLMSLPADKLVESLRAIASAIPGRELETLLTGGGVVPEIAAVAATVVEKFRAGGNGSSSAPVSPPAATP